MPTLTETERFTKTIETVLYEIKDAEPMTKLYGRTNFVPDSLQVTYEDGNLKRVSISGFRALKNGLSDARMGDTYSGWGLKDLPDYIKDVLGLPALK